MSEDDPLAGEPFGYRMTKSGLLQLLHEGRMVETLRGKPAAKLHARLERATPRDVQLLVAKATGQFKFGNERLGKDKGRGR